MSREKNPGYKDGVADGSAAERDRSTARLRFQATALSYIEKETAGTLKRVQASALRCR